MLPALSQIELLGKGGPASEFKEACGIAFSSCCGAKRWGTLHDVAPTNATVHAAVVASSSRRNFEVIRGTPGVEGGYPATLR
ncbi:hypothetical protein Cst04h_01420 [Corynebacterium striatum]|uniref:Uncharacterized protein n=1 Tax=Corynebacterium striatum TaxID=43770 RepID=A0ABC9ZIQ5_CORST|nr:hypothetical protein Cst04h_01420 [Corynebacterium striatum]